MTTNAAAPTTTTMLRRGAVSGLKRLLKNGTYNVDLVDGDGNTLASAKLTVAAKKKKKKK